jgi:hypothetical protein
MPLAKAGLTLIAFETFTSLFQAEMIGVSLDFRLPFRPPPSAQRSESSYHAR